MTWMDLLLLILDSFRLTHLLVLDAISEPLRRPLGGQPFLGKLLSWYWCAGIGVSAALLCAYTYWPGLTRSLLLLLAIAGGQALLESLVQREGGE